MDGLAKIIAIVLPLNGRYVLSPDFISALISFARSKIFKIVALSKSLMCRKSFRPELAGTAEYQKEHKYENFGPSFGQILNVRQIFAKT